MLTPTVCSYAPIPHLLRQVKEDIVMPLSTPICGIDGSLINEIPVPKDTLILIGALASNCNPQLWGHDAEEWKPERWLDRAPNTVANIPLSGIYSSMWVESSVFLNVRLIRYQRIKQDDIFWWTKGLHVSRRSRDGQRKLIYTRQSVV